MKIDWKKVMGWLKFVAIIIGGVVTFLMAKKLVTAVIGKVDKPKNWTYTNPNDHFIYIQDEKGDYNKVDLPNKLKAKDIKAAGIGKDKFTNIEVKHEKVDRRNVSPLDSDSAFDRLRGQ